MRRRVEIETRGRVVSITLFDFLCMSSSLTFFSVGEESCTAVSQGCSRQDQAGARRTQGRESEGRTESSSVRWPPGWALQNCKLE